MIHSASADNCLAITGHVHRDSRHFYTAGIYALKLLLVFRQTLSNVLYPVVRIKTTIFQRNLIVASTMPQLSSVKMYIRIIYTHLEWLDRDCPEDTHS